tara:strand:+ start:628 stop:1497 length:870 start_codon:yes stop_codon:yes gene_type:complete
MRNLLKKSKIKFFWLTLERFPSLFRPSSKPYISGDTFRNYSDHIFDETKSVNPKLVKNKDVIFVKADLLEIYFKIIHPKIKNRYILITHNSDREISNKEINLADEKIIKWFAQNLTVSSNENIFFLPIGLENLRRLKHGRKKWFKKRTYKKSKYILSSFNKLTNFGERSGIAKNLDNNLIEFKEYPSTSSYFNDLIEFKFVICPPGNGFDTHRVWESLILRTVPIHKLNKFTSILKNNGVPGLYIQNWEDLNSYTKNQLDEYYYNFNREDFEKFSSYEYWISKFTLLKR